MLRLRWAAPAASGERTTGSSSSALRILLDLSASRFPLLWDFVRSTHSSFGTSPRLEDRQLQSFGVFIKCPNNNIIRPSFMS